MPEEDYLYGDRSITMDKRKFLKTAGILGAGVVLSPVMACKTGKTSVTEQNAVTQTGSIQANKFLLPELGYATGALEPAIDAFTMEIHHGKHHAAYVANLNKAMEAEVEKYAGKSLEDILRSVTNSETAVRNNGGGHWNHSAFWQWIKPGGSKTPGQELAAAINASFGTFEAFQQKFEDAAKSRFGSGWAWLSVGKDKKLFVSSTPNQDNPMMKNLVETSGTPILGIDVWEHAYYLNYQNKRPDYIKSFMGIINWDTVDVYYKNAMAE